MSATHDTASLTSIGPEGATTPGLSPEQLARIAEAEKQGRPIRRAVVVAHVSGWTIACFAVFALLGGIFDMPTLLLGLALTAVAAIEMRGARRMRTLDDAAPRLLAWNQVALAVFIVAYSGWNIGMAIAGPGAYDEHIAAGGALAESLEPIDRLTRTVTTAIYVAVALGSILAQGLSALYYLTRRKHIVSFRDATPTWVVQTLRAAA